MARRSGKVVPLRSETAPAVSKAEGDGFGADGSLRRFAGAERDRFNAMVANQTMATAFIPPAWGEAAAETRRNATIEGLIEVAPRDAVEGMLAAQMVATHGAAMECFRRAMIPEQPVPVRDMNLSQANRLVRSYAALVVALDKHRGKGQQTVRVEHVHVHSGGQAIVGNVANGVAAPALEQVAMVALAPVEAREEVEADG